MGSGKDKVCDKIILLENIIIVLLLIAFIFALILESIFKLKVLEYYEDINLGVIILLIIIMLIDIAIRIYSRYENSRSKCEKTTKNIYEYQKLKDQIICSEKFLELFSEYVDELKLKDSEFVDSHWIRELKNEMLKMLAYVPELNDIKIMIEENSDISPENAPKENIKKGIETVGTVMKQDVISIVDLLHYIYCESNSDKVKEKNFYIEKYYNKVFFQTQQLILKDRRKMEEYKN